MNNTSPIVISDSDTEDAPETFELGSDEISQFNPTSLTSGQMIDLDHRLPSENEDHSSPNTFQKYTSRISKRQTPIQIVNINDIIKGSPSSGLQEIIARENAAPEKSTIVFSKTNNNLFVIRKQNPASVSRTENANCTNKLLPIPTVRKLINVSGLLAKTDVKETKKTPTKISYRCLDLKKNSYKRDTEGFTFFDRQGFFKAEEKRARRCLNILQLHIKVRQQVVDALVQEYENRRFRYESQRNVVVTVDNRLNKVINKKKIETMKLAICNKIESKIEPKIEPKSKKKIDKPKLKKPNRISPTLGKKKLKQKTNKIEKELQIDKPKLKKPNRISPTLGKKKLKQKTNKIEKELQIDKPKLKKPNRISLTLTDKKNLKQKTNKTEKGLQTPAESQRIENLEKNKYMVSKLNVPLDHDKFRLSAKKPVSNDNNMPATFIDENNFEIMEQLDFHRNDGEIYFVNEHKVVTALYMDTFPAFKNAVQFGKVKILDKVNLSSETVPSKTLNINRNCDAKHTAFCDFMTSFHTSQKNSMFESNVSSEHSYSITTY